MGMDKAMIDWTKPIETVDGRKARLVLHMDENQRIIYVNGMMSESGDVFLVNDEGYIYSKRQEPFIRNVRVKREGWVNIYAVHKTEAAAIQCRSQHEGVVTRFVRWEE
jgi:hypothetical protein